MAKYTLIEKNKIVGSLVSYTEVSQLELCKLLGWKSTHKTVMCKVEQFHIDEAKKIKAFIFKYGAYIPNLRRIFLSMCGLDAYGETLPKDEKDILIESCMKILEIE